MDLMSDVLYMFVMLMMFCTSSCMRVFSCGHNVPEKVVMADHQWYNYSIPIMLIFIFPLPFNNAMSIMLLQIVAYILCWKCTLMLSNI